MKYLLIAVLALGWASPVGRAADNDLETQAAAKRQWIVITTPQFREALAPLIRHRTEQGYQVTIHEPKPKDSAKEVQKLIARACESFAGTSAVLLVGEWEPGRPASHLPALRGSHGRMSGRFTDHGYGKPDQDGATTVAVGRFPARSTEDVHAMVEKTLRFERQAFGPWSNRVDLLVGHPGGKTGVERQTAELFIQNAMSSRLQRLHPRWRTGCIVDITDSPFAAADDGFGDAMSKAFRRGGLITCYAGHSWAGGIWSSGKSALSAEDFGRLNISESSGVFVTTGCFACQIKGNGGTGFAVAGFRNPRGFAAVIGSFAESYAAPGQLALDGMIQRLNQEQPPRSLGDYWLGIQSGLARGKMKQVTFWLYDQADGSGGKVSLARQRHEHLEMWTLLGDPALQLPITRSTINIDLPERVESGSDVEIVAQLKDPRYDGAQAFVSLESRYVPSVVPKEKKPALFGEVVAKEMTAVQEGQVRWRLPWPERLTGSSLTVRVTVPSNDGRASLLGSKVIRIESPPAE